MRAMADSAIGMATSLGAQGLRSVGVTTFCLPTFPQSCSKGFPLCYSGFLSLGCLYHRRVSDLPDPVSRWEVFKFIFLGVSISAVLTAVVVLIALRAANP